MTEITSGVSCIKRKRQKQGQCSQNLICHLYWQRTCLTSQTSQKSPGLTKPSWRRLRQKRRTLFPPKRVSVCYITAYGVSNHFGCGVGLSSPPSVFLFSAVFCLSSLFIILLQPFVSLQFLYYSISICLSLSHCSAYSLFLQLLMSADGCQFKVLHQHCSADLSLLAEFPMWISILFAIMPRSLAWLSFKHISVSLKKFYWHNKGIYPAKGLINIIFNLSLFSAIEQERKGDATPWPKRQGEDEHKTCSSDMADITIPISV